MVSSLAGSLALVTCKEPLRVSLTNQLRGMLQGQANIDTAALEHAVQVSGWLHAYHACMPACQMCIEVR